MQCGRAVKMINEPLDRKNSSSIGYYNKNVSSRVTFRDPSWSWLTLSFRDVLDDQADLRSDVTMISFTTQLY